MSSLGMASLASACLASVGTTVSRQPIPVPQWNVRLPPSVSSMPPAWLVVPASLATPAAQPLLAQRLTCVPVLNVSMATVPTMVPTSPAPVHLAGKEPPARRMWQSVPPTPASTAALALNWSAASPAAALLVGLGSPATRTLMSVSVILAGEFDQSIHHLLLDSDSLPSGMGCVVTLLAPTSVLATPVGAAKTAT